MDEETGSVWRWSTEKRTDTEFKVAMDEETGSVWRCTRAVTRLHLMSKRTKKREMWWSGSGERTWKHAGAGRDGRRNGKCVEVAMLDGLLAQRTTVASGEETGSVWRLQ